MILYNFQSITRKGKYKIDFVMMLSRNDCVLKTSGNFKITSLVARYSLSCPVQPITSSLISPLGIVPLLESLIITARSYEAYSNTQHTNILAYFLHWPVTFCPLILFTVEGRCLPVCPWHRMLCSPGLLLSLCDVTPEPRPGARPAKPGLMFSQTGAPEARGRPGEDNGTMVSQDWIMFG